MSSRFLEPSNVAKLPCPSATPKVKIPPCRTSTQVSQICQNILVGGDYSYGSNYPSLNASNQFLNSSNRQGGKPMLYYSESVPSGLDNIPWENINISKNLFNRPGALNRPYNADYNCPAILIGAGYVQPLSTEFPRRKYDGTATYVQATASQKWDDNRDFSPAAHTHDYIPKYVDTNKLKPRPKYML